ncbi:MAG TPA: hypothetical protein VKT77_19705 [Chthonomonadaceae bacterium]|nr:hypothetical protein [Chthonomonadaceae bacterium]
MSQDAAGTVLASEVTATSEREETLRSPYCREIRSKRYFFLREMPTEHHHIKDGSNHCWCRMTMKAYGPDGELARPEDCNSGRSCYRSLFEPE